MKFADYKKEKMQNAEFKQAYEELGPEYEIIKAIVDARASLQLTQKQLAERTGIQQSHISRMERGNYNPSLKFLKRIAAGLGKELHIEFR